MKKIIVALSALLVTLVTTSTAAERSEIDPRILSAFQKEFSFAKNVTWEVQEKVIVASFFLNDQRFVAWYSQQAELIATARNILYMQLPLTVIKTLEEYYADASVSTIVEVTRDGETFYQVEAQKKNKKFLLKANPSGNITVLKRIK